MSAATTQAAVARLNHLARRGLAYWRRFGTRATVQRALAWSTGRAPVAAAAGPVAGLVVPHTADHAVPSTAQWLQSRFEAVTPLRTYPLPSQARRRVTLLTDSIGKGSLFGGVGTALILGALLANRYQADLRIVTRTEPPEPGNVDHVLGVYGIELQQDMQFRFVPPGDPRQELDLLADEIVITTSWWTTAAALPSVPHSAIVYLLQEDERMFYPFGDERLRCEHVLRTSDIRVVVNTQLLLDHLIADGFDNLQRSAICFEPAFPQSVFAPRAKAAGAKSRFVFYARPNNPRNLFFLGIEVIDRAVVSGILDPAKWDIVLVGKDIPPLSFGAGHVPTRLENLNWSDYAELVGGADLALSLMATPHPSYPPLDLAASGAVVVTNRHGIKQALDGYSDNLICCEANVPALLAGLAQGVALAQDTVARQHNHRHSALARDWSQTLSGVIERLAARPTEPLAARPTDRPAAEP